MKILLYGNAPWMASGYGSQIKNMLQMFSDLGHECAVVCDIGLTGTVTKYAGVPIYPSATPKTRGLSAIEPWVNRIEPDLVISLMDAWVIHPGLGTKWAPYFPVDGEPLGTANRVPLSESLLPIAMSKFGLRVTREAGFECEYVPHAIDVRTYWAPAMPWQAREASHLPQDVYLYGMVAANQSWISRKSLPQVLAAFAQVHARHSDTRLYMHTDLTGRQPGGGLNLSGLIEHLGLIGSVISVDPHQYTIGYPESHMALIYRSLDVLVSPSMGEGFGLPIIEAQSCGTPVIVGDWSSMSELCSAGWLIPREDSEPWWSDINTYHRLPHVGAIAEAMELAYNYRGPCHEDQARDSAKKYGLSTVRDSYWSPVLEKLALRLSSTG